LKVREPREKRISRKKSRVQKMKLMLLRNAKRLNSQERGQMMKSLLSRLSNLKLCFKKQ